MNDIKSIKKTVDILTDYEVPFALLHQAEAQDAPLSRA